jgi:hypothetical protein
VEHAVIAAREHEETRLAKEVSVLVLTLLCNGTHKVEFVSDVWRQGVHQRVVMKDEKVLTEGLLNFSGAPLRCRPVERLYSSGETVENDQVMADIPILSR